MKNLAGMMKQAQQMQSKMQEMQAKLEAMEITGEAGAGLVKVTMNGKSDMRKLKIDPKIVDPAETQMLEDLILAATRDARTMKAGKLNRVSVEVHGVNRLVAVRRRRREARHVDFGHLQPLRRSMSSRTHAGLLENCSPATRRQRRTPGSFQPLRQHRDLRQGLPLFSDSVPLRKGTPCCRTDLPPAVRSRPRNSD